MEEVGCEVNEYLDMLDALFWPDLIIVGGGVSKKADKFFHFLDVAPSWSPRLENEAGIVGAALIA